MSPQTNKNPFFASSHASPLDEMAATVKYWNIYGSDDLILFETVTVTGLLVLLVEVMAILIQL